MYLSWFVIAKAMSYKVFVVVLVLMLGVALLFAYLEHTYDNTKQRLRIPSVVLVNAPEKIFYVFKSYNKRVTGIVEKPSPKLIQDFKIIKGNFCKQLKRLKTFIQHERYLLWYISQQTELKDIMCLDQLLRMYPKMKIAEKRPFLPDEHIYPIRDILLQTHQWRSIDSFI